MSKHCPEEFNPWPPFVDIFASVILVMLLFLLITIVNIGYYAQFKYKKSFTASVETKVPIQPEESSKITTTYAEKKEIVIKKERPVPPKNSVSFHKISKPEIQSNAKNSFFSGGQNEGNAVSYAINKDQKAFLAQKAFQKTAVLHITFEDKEVFINTKIRSQLRHFISNALRKSKKAEFTVTVTDPHNIMSKTISKQISLGRAINIKNQIQKSRVPNQQIHLNLRKPSADLSEFGTITIQSRIP
jgi:hypothetical protein